MHCPSLEFTDGNQKILRHYGNPSLHCWSIILSFQERCTSLWDQYQRNALSVTGVSTTWATDKNWLTKLLETWKVTQLNLLHQKSDKSCVRQIQLTIPVSLGWPSRHFCCSGPLNTASSNLWTESEVHVRKWQCLLVLRSQPYLWASSFWVRILHTWPVF